MDKKHIEDIKRDLVEGFKILYNDLHTSENWEKVDEETKKKVEDLKELISICDDVSLRVKFVCTMPDGTEKHTQYQEIQNFVKEGFDLKEGVERIQVHVKAVVRKGEMVMESDDKTPFYKSETFLIEENINSQTAKLFLDSIKHDQGNAKLISRQDLQDFCYNRIRFPENQTLEV